MKGGGVNRALQDDQNGIDLKHLCDNDGRGWAETLERKIELVNCSRASESPKVKIVAVKIHQTYIVIRNEHVGQHPSARGAKLLTSQLQLGAVTQVKAPGLGRTAHVILFAHTCHTTSCEQ